VLEGNSRGKKEDGRVREEEGRGGKRREEEGRGGKRGEEGYPVIVVQYFQEGLVDMGLGGKSGLQRG
jgi:hypothetical protein